MLKSQHLPIGCLKIRLIQFILPERLKTQAMLIINNFPDFEV